MGTLAIAEIICDRCAALVQVRKGDEHSQWGETFFRRINGSGADHIGTEKDPADLCEKCSDSLLKWWKRHG